jgi:hypothetical protein
MCPSTLMCAADVLAVAVAGVAATCFMTPAIFGGIGTSVIG